MLARRRHALSALPYALACSATASSSLLTASRHCVFTPPGPPPITAKPNARGLKETFGDQIANANRGMLGPQGFSDLRDKTFQHLGGRAAGPATKWTMDRSTIFDEWRHVCPEPVGFHMSKLGTTMCKFHKNRNESGDALQLQIIKGCNVFEIDAANIGADFENTSKALQETLEAFELNRAGFVIMARCGFLNDDPRREELSQEPVMSNTAPVRNKMVPVMQRVITGSFPQVSMSRGFKISEMTDDQYAAINLGRTYMHGVALALSPQWIEAALMDLFNHTHVDCIDVLMIQGIEYLYENNTEAKADEILLQCFVFLEKQVKQGNVQWYGVSSPNFTAPVLRVDPPLPPDAKIPDHLRNPKRNNRVVSLYRVMAIAKKAGGDDHRLRFVEYPVNLTQHHAMSAQLPYDGNHTLQTLCKSLQLTSVGIQPLETRDLFKQIQRYHSFPLEPNVKVLRMNFFSSIERLALKEMEVQKTYDANEKNLPPRNDVFIGSIYVMMLQRQLTSYFHFCNAMDNVIFPKFHRSMSKLQEAATGELKEWCGTYENMAHDVFRMRRRLLEHKHGMKAAQMNMLLDVCSPTLAECPIFSQKALTFAQQGCDVLLSGFHVARYFHEATSLNPIRSATIPRAEMEALFASPDVTFANHNPPDPYMMEHMSMGKFSKQKSKLVERSIQIDHENPKFPDLKDEVE